MNHESGTERTPAGAKMYQERSEISYDEYFLEPVKERLKIFNEISAGNRALLIRTHTERWLAANRSRLTSEQVAVVEEVILKISPNWYKTDRHFEKIDPEAEALVKKLESVLTRGDARQFSADRADYIPVVEDGNG